MAFHCSSEEIGVKGASHLKYHIISKYIEMIVKLYENEYFRGILECWLGIHSSIKLVDKWKNKPHLGKPTLVCKRKKKWVTTDKEKAYVS